MSPDTARPESRPNRVMGHEARRRRAHDSRLPQLARAGHEELNRESIGVDNAGLTPGDVAALRESLQEQRLFRQEQLQQIGGASQARADQVRGQHSASQTEVHIKLAACARMVLAEVEAALQRIDQGQYGRCQLCTRPIVLDRLRIVPQARYCTRCQQVREAGR
ncbi:TraR/DksA family transcriptional regulator [Streptomyces sp. NPDC057460]|uniref:TraR/DksA family transcriptional regulator n=1 Tax=Streptomyces sp. NPDC057460 TaxID=3346141 RepID=UPI0036A2D417